MGDVETKTAEQHQYTLEQLSQRIDDMRTRRVWGRFIVHFQDGVIVRLTREENERAGDDTTVVPIREAD